ncbi:thioredoxin-like protein [Meira miltonrushii]|uniref:Thioredoxin n=1 Tax=Meira miltonrushii TaxID=1280837 RepID=A0A316VFQ8_9BASI|nr:thioredoxin-like protein [Meira miltonrushii]PWN36356.1 thioredoxin-like protein [Meira miltonrushii]
MATVISSTAEFDKTLSSAGEKLVVVDFTASWCPPCKMIAPVFDSLARQHGQNAHFLKVDVDQFQQIAQRYGVRAMPTFVFIRKGGILDQLRGANASKLTEMVSQYINKGSAVPGSGTFPGSGHSLAGGSGSAGAPRAGGILGQIPRENLVPFAIVIAYLAYVVWSKS